jgi:mRNA interferase RelE/StbE
MRYNVTIKKKAAKVLEKINEPYYSSIKTALYSLADDPRPFGYKKLKGNNGYRIRVGNYRIIYEIFDKILLVDVINLGDRKEIYE